MKPINLEDWTRDFFGNATRGQALLIHEARRELARELIRRINELAQHGRDSTSILREVIAFCELELMKADTVDGSRA